MSQNEYERVRRTENRASVIFSEENQSAYYQLHREARTSHMYSQIELTETTGNRASVNVSVENQSVYDQLNREARISHNYSQIELTETTTSNGNDVVSDIPNRQNIQDSENGFSRKKYRYYYGALAIVIVIVIGGIACGVWFGIYYNTKQDNNDCVVSPDAWTDWSSLGPCSVSCVSEKRIRNRTCTGQLYEVNDVCSDVVCIDAWSDWSSWSSCSLTCGNGSRIRDRNCTAKYCGDDNMDMDLCIHPVCIVEDSTPSFLVPSSTTVPVSVGENSPEYVTVLLVEAEDLDGNTLSYELVSQTPTSPLFALDTFSGQLKTPTGLDAEFSLTYSFTFGVSDGSTTVFSVPYTLNIIDINEFTPVFQGTPYRASLLNPVSNGHPVTKVSATDADATSTVTYSLISGNSPVIFSLDSNTGMITVYDNTQLDPASALTYSLVIQASDGTKTVTLTVSVTVIVDYCYSRPCHEGSTCSLSITYYTCTCAVGYIGKNCDQDDPCYNNPCINGGTCTTSGTSYTCNCTLGFTGTNCTAVTGPLSGNR